MVTSKIHRLTFSKSLADLIVKTLGANFQVRRFKFRLGNRLNPNQRSPNGIYALVSSRKSITLRIALTYDSAEIYNDNDSRYLSEVWVSE